MRTKEKRLRRRPEEARALILDAAEAQMTVDGPAGLRLKEVARAAGVSHPTILHHFGSREGLVRALHQRGLQVLRASVLAQLEAGQAGGESIQRVFAAYRNGMAQRILWLVQYAQPEVPGGLKFFEEVVEALHALRLKLAAPGVAPNIEDTRAVVHMTTMVAFGDALIGSRLRQGDGARQQAEQARFEAWFAALLDLYLMDKAGRR